MEIFEEEQLIKGFGSLRTSDIESLEFQTPDQNIAQAKETRLQLRHHKIARLAAIGCFNQTQIAERVGMTNVTICNLLKTPAIQALIHEYRQQVSTEEIADYQRLITVRDQAVVRMEDEIITGKINGKDLIHAVNSLLDRTGLPTQREVKIDSRNINLDLNKAREEHFAQQAAKIPQETIDVEYAELTTLDLEATIDALFEKKED